jgi:hypothetical protein
VGVENPTQIRRREDRVNLLVSFYSRRGDGIQARLYTAGGRHFLVKESYDMPERPKDRRSLEQLRAELASLVRRSMSNLTEIARIQLRIQELSARLGRISDVDLPNPPEPPPEPPEPPTSA